MKCHRILSPMLLFVLILLGAVYSPTVFAATGGELGVWYGTNNITDYNTPQANGSGGKVYLLKNSWWSQMTNRDANFYDTKSDKTMSVRISPDASNNFKIKSVQYGYGSCTWDQGDGQCNGNRTAPGLWTSVSVTDPNTDLQFDVSISGGRPLYIWVVFDIVGANYTVSGDPDKLSDAACTSNSMLQSPQTVPKGGTASFTLSTSSNCTIDCVSPNADGSGCVTTGLSGMTYTTPAINGDSTFYARFKPVGLTINASVDSSSPSGCGTISPLGSVGVAQGSNQSFSITVNSGCSVSHVYVTDANVSYSNVDLAPLTGNVYTFNNIQSNGAIKVYFTATVPAAGNDYCQIPPFIQGQTSLAPNVLIIFDNSGSMGGGDTDGYAYFNNKTYSCTASHNATTNLCPTIFYGYFDPYKMYKPDTTNANVYLLDNVTLNMADTAKSGNYLNYRYMHKVDVIRKVLVGGKVVTDKGQTALAGTNRATVATKYLYTDNGKWIQYGADEPKGIVQNMSGRVRFGLEVFGTNAGSTSDGGQIVAKLGAPVGDIVTAIEGPSTDPKTSTPIAEAIYEAVRYFEAKPSAYNSNTNYGDSTWNPPDNPIIQYPCQKHFVLLLTDGEANSTDKLPGLTNPSLNGYTDTSFDIKTWVNRIATADKPAPNNDDYSGQYVDAMGYYAHITDLRSTALSNAMAGKQNLTFYSIYAFGNGTGTKTLQSLSKYGGFESLNGDDAGTAPNQYPSPDLAKEWDSDGNGVPDTYFEGDDGAVLESSIISAMTDILAKVASGTAASILSNSEGSGANLLQAVFYPNKIFKDGTEVNWIGEMQNLWYYIDPLLNNSTIREDTDFPTTTPDHVLDLAKDNIANFYFNGTETFVSLSSDSNGDGLAETNISTTLSPDDVQSIWRVGQSLWSKSADSRTIHTSVTGYSLLLPAAETPPKGGFYAPSTTATRTTALQPYLQAADGIEAKKIIDYIRGTDQLGYRNRMVKLTAGGTLSTWKMGDIITSTPRIQSAFPLNNYHLDPAAGYGDVSYQKFISTTAYKNRGMAYVGANDGMFHAFKFGKLVNSGASIAGTVKAKLTGTNLGEEQWAYIPRNALPYLKYFTDKTSYKHLYYVDGQTSLADVSIGSCFGASDYSLCQKDTVAGSNWRTVLIGSMGYGGAAKIKDDTACTAGVAGTCVKTPIFDPADSTKGVGYSSYFAFDVTTQTFDATTGALNAAPVFKWEFSDPRLGYSTTGATIVRIGARKTVTNPGGETASIVDNDKNGKWFAVMASGPTGPIDTDAHQFLARSDQELKIFVIDLGATIDDTHPLVEGTNYWVISTGISNAFAGSILGAGVDVDRKAKTSDGFYQDDVLYIGYTQANTSTISSTTEWTNGGILRLLTKESADPSQWKVSTLVSGIGPVTAGLAKLQDTYNKKLYVYGGSGRYYYSGDDSTNRRYIVGVQDGCYTSLNTIDKNCDTASGAGKALTLNDLENQSSTCHGISKGWYILLRANNTSNDMDAERVISAPTASPTGMVYVPSFSPTSDVCSFGGSSFLWALKFDNGCVPFCQSLKGRALLQMSTGALADVNFADLFACDNGDGTILIPPPPVDPPKIKEPGPGNYLSPPATIGAGQPPGPGGGGFKPPVPRKQILHIRER